MILNLDQATTNGLENPVGNCLIFIMLLVSFYLRWISGIQPSGGTDLASVFRNCAKPSEVDLDSLAKTYGFTHSSCYRIDSGGSADIFLLLDIEIQSSVHDTS